MDKPSVTITTTDIDIDTHDRQTILNLFKHTPAMYYKNTRESKHNTGVYFHKVPVNPFTGNCAVEYRDAENYGFFKLDILNVHIYKNIKNEEHLLRLMNAEPIWELLMEKDFCDMLFHLNGYHDVCKIMKPNSVEKLAAVLAMIRPSKKYLIGADWDTVFREVWVPPTDGSYYYKISHSLSYSVAVVVHMNLLVEELQENS